MTEPKVVFERNHARYELQTEAVSNNYIAGDLVETIREWETDSFHDTEGMALHRAEQIKDYRVRILDHGE